MRLSSPGLSPKGLSLGKRRLTINVIQHLYDKKLCNLGGNHWLVPNLCYQTMMGSVAYGVASDTSDVDLYAFCIPTKRDVFPHLKNEICGFGEAKNGHNRFTNFQQHHVEDKESGKVYDLNVYNIVDYFQLAMGCNPNVLDSLFVPQFCVLQSTKVGQIVRENRKMFLHLGAWHTYKGYSFSQISKAKTKKPIGKRKEAFDRLGYCPKFLYHVVRLLNQVEQILVEGDMDLQRSREQLKSIRREEWTFEEVRDYFSKKELELETLYTKNPANLPWGPKDKGLQDKIKALLLQCLEEHYGSLDKCITDEEAPIKALREIDEILKRNRSLI